MRRGPRTPAISALRTSRFTRLLVVPVTLVALASGCYKWGTPSQFPASLIRHEEPSKVRLTLTDGRSIVVENPTVTETALFGQAEGSRVTIPLGEIEQVEQRRFDALATLLLSGTVVFVTWYIADNCTVGGCTTSPVP